MTEPIKVEKVAIYGAGMMGHCIGQEFAVAGYPVTLYGRSRERLETALGKIERGLNELVEVDLLTDAEIPAVMQRIEATTDLEQAVHDVDLVIESVLEDLALKQKVFAELDRLAPRKTILASNTSSILPSDLASATTRPEKVLVAHFFNPPHLMPLVEVVKGQLTENAVAQSIYDLLKAMGKSAVMVNKEVPGFIGNRLQMALFREAAYLVDQGIASAEDVDLAVTASFGRRLPFAGPFRYLEYIDGWEQVRQIESYLRADLDVSASTAPVIIDKIAAGELGMETGQGFYSWTPEETERWRRAYVQHLQKYLVRPNGGENAETD